MVDISYCSYLRVSTDKQGITGLGMDAQREAVSRYVQNRGQIIAEFIEVESGRKVNRPQLQAALDECRRRRAVLLIARLDRLARNVAFIANLMNSDVEFVAVDMPQANRLTIHILAAVAEHEREMISQRTKAALAAAKARGKKLGNPNYAEALAKARAALGYKPPPPQVVGLMAEWRGHRESLRAIAGRLNALNIRTPQGAQWHASTVRAALLRQYTQDLKPKENTATFSTTESVYQQRRGGAPMPANINEAQRMIDVFSSVGAREFVVTKTDINKAVKWGKPYMVAELKNLLPAMVRTATARKPVTLENGETTMAGENLIVRPRGPDVAFVQLDDLSTDQLDRVRPASFMMLATSPGSHQAWIAVSGVQEGKEQFKQFMRRVRKAVGGNDKAASHATRVAGTENFKPQYSPDYPVVSIIHAVPGRVMTPERLEEMGLLAAPEPVAPLVEDINVSRKFSGSTDRPWPSYQITLSRTRPRKDGTGPDRSLADFNWAMTSLTGGKGVEETIAKLLEVSERAKERVARGDEGYPRITVQNAADAVARNYGKGRSRA